MNYTLCIIVCFFMSTIFTSLPQSAVVYSVAYNIPSDYPAPSFFSVDASNGQIEVIKDLKTDNLKLTTYSVSVH